MDTKIIDEIKQFFNRVISAKTQIINDIFDKETLNPNELSVHLNQVHLSPEPNSMPDGTVQDPNAQSMEQQTSNAHVEQPVNTTIAERTIEQFRLDGKITVDEQTQIVDFMHQFVGENVRILRDYAYESWNCFQYRPETTDRFEVIRFFTPTVNFRWKEFHTGNKNISQEIEQWLPNLTIANPFEIVQVSKCHESNDPHTQFLLVLVYAFGCCLEFPQSFIEPFGHTNNEEKIREVISGALTGNQMPTIEDMWGVQPAN